MLFNKILSLCEKHGYLKPQLINNKLLDIAPLGALLQENLKNEWYYNVVINRDTTILWDNGSFLKTFDYLKELCLNEPPFGIAEIIDEKNKINSQDNQNVVNNRNFNNFFDKSQLLKVTVIVPPSKSTQYFYDWQRQRNIWWRKLSAYPGRYSLSDIKMDEKTQNVEILAEYTWNKQLVESITLSTKSHPILNLDQLNIKDNKKFVTGHTITSKINLSTMLLNTLCDAYDEPLFQGNPRPLLRFHRKLAPYKISFAISSTNKKSVVVDDLKDLALYLSRQLRSNHVSSLYLPSSYKYTLEKQWQQYDEIGIPYNILLNENTLNDGIILLRNRDTTLKEQVHVSDLPNYIEQLFKNY